MGYYCRLSTQNYQALMAEYGKKRGGVEFEYLMVLFFRLRGYYGWNRAVHMLSGYCEPWRRGLKGRTMWKTGLPRTTYRSQVKMRATMTWTTHRTRARGHGSQHTLCRGDVFEGEPGLLRDERNLRWTSSA